MSTGTAKNWKDMPGDSREKYNLYLCSREWWTVRDEVKTRCNGMCERCRRDEMAHVHHLTYIRKYREKPEDLQGLCKGCHNFIHKLSDFDPLAYFKEESPFIVINDGFVQCPSCRGEQDYVHIHGVSVLQNLSSITVTRHGATEKKLSSNGSRRGSQIQICYVCECGCKFLWEMQFHKGNTQFETVIFDKRTQFDGDELWRD